MISKKISFAAIAVSFAISTIGSAATLVDFKPMPVSPFGPEFVFNGGPVPSFKEGPAAHGNGDGALPVGAQTPGGLDAETPFTLPPIPGSQLTGTGSTLFHDATLVLNGLVASGLASAPFGPGGVLIQPLGVGSFELYSTGAPSNPGGPVMLLTGNIGAATFIVGQADAGATFNGSNVDYTGGAIYAALIGSGGNPNGNSMSFSMTDVNPNFSIGGSGYLSDFTANGTGLFNYNPVPEPSTLCLLILGSIALIGRRR